MLRQYFVWIHNAVGVEYCLDALHVVYHGLALRVVQEACLLEADAVLGADAASCFFDEVHDERLDHVIQLLLEGFVLVARDGDVQVQVAVANVAETGGQDLLLLGGGKLGGVGDEGSGLVHDSIEVLAG